MSYYRPVRVDELKDWLVDQGLKEEEAATLAQALDDRFDVLTFSMTAR